MRKLSARLVILLAVIAAVVLAGLIAGRNMWGYIIAYWAVLTIKFQSTPPNKGATRD